MADNCGSAGVFSRVAFDFGAPGGLAAFTGADYSCALTGNTSLSQNSPHINNSAIDGQVVEPSEQTRTGLSIVDGDVPMMASPKWFEVMGPAIFGKAFVGGVNSLDTTVPSEFQIALHRDALIYIYNRCRINTVTIGSESGGVVNASIGVLGVNRDPTPVAGTTWPVGLDVDSQTPFTHENCVITIGGTQYEFRSWQLTVNQNLQPVYFGANTPCGIKRLGKAQVSLQLVGQHTASTVTNILQGATPPNALEVKVTMTHPTPSLSTVFDFPAVQIPPQDPPVVEGELLLDLTGQCRTKVGAPASGSAWVVTNDNTP